MIKTPIFKGACTAVITPFADNGIDYARFSQNIEQQYESGVAAIVVCGTTGENATLSESEHNELVRAAVRDAAGRIKVIAGVGSNNTQTALKYAENARSFGADAILMVTPYYNKTTQTGLIEHFTYVADRVDLPLILYNVPSRTGIGLSADTCRILSLHPNINGIKEASGDIALAADIKALCGDDLFIWSGNDSCTVPIMSLGGLGVISVASNILPQIVVKLCQLCLENNFTDATALYSKYCAIFSALFMETNPIPVKAAMKLMGFDSGKLRLPLVEMSDKNRAKLIEQMRNVGINIC